MAHTCPICYQVCHCKGDIDDILFDREPPGGCVHYKRESCEQDEDDWDEDDWYEYDGLNDEEELKPTPDGGLHDEETGITDYP